MRVLYGVVGEGMGHATRSAVVLDHLLQAGHQVRVVVSGRAHAFLTSRFAGRTGIGLAEIHGLHLSYEGNAVDKSETLLSNLQQLPAGVVRNVAHYQKVAEEGFLPQVVISDFETWAYLYGLNHRLPVISIDNMQVLNRCRHDDDVTADGSMAFRLAKAAVKLKLPGAYHYLITSFFFPQVRKTRTTLVPPILRPEVLGAVREPGPAVLVYQTAAANADTLLRTIKALPYQFRVYGTGREGQEDNVTLCPFSATGFVEDLRRARAVIAGGGFSLMGEAVHLRVPMLSIPLSGQYEQELNARYLQKLDYGAFSPTLDGAVIQRFLERSAHHAQALQAYRPQDNSMLMTLLDALLARVAKGQGPVDALSAPSMGQLGVSTSGTSAPPLAADDHDDDDDDAKLGE